jgi:dienelactone hydrolase
MFPLSYGGGAIRQLCEDNNLVLFSPKTEPVMASAALLDALSARAATHYDIDPTRIYIIGHSMGAMATASLAAQRPLTIAAAACIAGGPLGQPPEGLARLPDMYIVGAELDGLVSPKRLETVTNRWADAGLPVKFKLAPGLGHTLSVGHELPQAVAFLVSKSLPGGMPAEALIELPVGNKSNK